MNIEWLIWLYPTRWRERYGDEFAALLEQIPFSFANLLDVLLGALDAHLNIQFSGRFSKMLETLRKSTVTVFCAYIAFIVAGMGFGGLADDSPFGPANRTYPSLGLAWTVVEIGAVVALMAAVIGGLPLALAVIRGAFAGKRRDVLALLSTPLIALAVLVIFAFGVTTFLPPDPSGSLSRYQPLLALSLHGLFALGAAASALGVSRAVVLSELDERPFRFAVIPAVVATLAMVMMLIAAVIWGLLARGYEPAAFDSGSYGYYGSQTIVSWIVVILLMVAATGVSASAAVRGLQARRAA